MSTTPKAIPGAQVIAAPGAISVPAFSAVTVTPVRTESGPWTIVRQIPRENEGRERDPERHDQRPGDRPRDDARQEARRLRGRAYARRAGQCAPSVQLSLHDTSARRDAPDCPRGHDDGNLVSAGGVTSGLDLAVYLLERELGPRIAHAVESLFASERRGTVWRATGPVAA